MSKNTTQCDKSANYQRFRISRSMTPPPAAPLTGTAFLACLKLYIIAYYYIPKNIYRHQNSFFIFATMEKPR